MEDCNERRENNELTRDVREDDTAREEESGFDNQYQLMRKSPFNNSKRNENEQYDRKPSRSRSRSRNRQLPSQQRKSANAFINFMQDFKQNYGKVKSKDLFRLGGQRWREMSSEEKMPYVKAAKLVKQQSQQNNKSEQTNKTNDSTKKSETQKDQKKKEREESRRSGSRRSRSRTDDESEMESDSATSGTAASMTSEDVSDLSS